MSVALSRSKMWMFFSSIRIKFLSMSVETAVWTVLFLNRFTRAPSSVSSILSILFMKICLTPASLISTKCSTMRMMSVYLSIITIWVLSAGEKKGMISVLIVSVLATTEVMG